MSVKVGIAGASGYAGGELLRLLLGHPEVELAVIAAGGKAGEPVTAVHPHLVALADRVFDETSAAALSGCDLVFLALPHGASAALARQLPLEVRIVDLGADFRLQSAAAWERYYGGAGPHAGTWLYGLPELMDKSELVGATRVANPGCYATAIALAAAPLLSAGAVDAAQLVAVAASGTSGAGRNPSEHLLASEVMGAISSYKTGGSHQHTPEIEQTLRQFDVRARLAFTPLLAPMPRGIHATVTAPLAHPASGLREHFADFYQASPFVTVLPAAVQPRTSSVLGSNQVQVQALVDEHAERAVVTLVLDNLVKGAAGQALQNANLMFGWPEQTGLTQLGVAP